MLMLYHYFFSDLPSFYYWILYKFVSGSPSPFTYEFCSYCNFFFLNSSNRASISLYYSYVNLSFYYSWTKMLLRRSYGSMSACLLFKFLISSNASINYISLLESYVLVSKNFMELPSFYYFLIFFMSFWACSASLIGS